MKTTCAIVVIAVAILNLQQSVAAKSSSSNSSQSMLDPLTIQEDTARDAARVKHDKSSKHLHTASGRQNNQRSQLSGAYELPSVGALSTFQKVPSLRAKTVRKHPQKGQKKAAAHQRSSLSWNGEPPQSLLQDTPRKIRCTDGTKRNKKARSSLTNQHMASTGGGKKNIFQSGADAVGSVITAPARGLRALFKPRKSS